MTSTLVASGAAWGFARARSAPRASLEAELSDRGPALTALTVPNPPVAVDLAPARSVEPEPEPAAVAKAVEAAAANEDDTPGPFDWAAANAAFASAAEQARHCKDDLSPAGVARVLLTFQPSGEASFAQVQGTPFIGTIEGQCIAARYRAIRVPAFSGRPLIVRTALEMP